MVLRLNDLPVGFGQDSGHYSGNVAAAKEGGSLADFIRWGRINGYESVFGRRAIVGLIKVSSASNTYKSARGARESLHASYRAALKPQAAGLKFTRLSTGGRIGHESRLYSLTGFKEGGLTGIGYIVQWRYRTVKASVIGAGIDGTVNAQAVVNLARKQQRRIEAALR